jgi:hypothetical protein
MIVYRPGKSNGNADALKRRPEDLHEVGTETLNNMEEVILKPYNLLEKLRISASEIFAHDHP